MNESGSTKQNVAPPRTRAARSTTRATTIVRPGDDQIRQRAYEIYLRRGGHPGDPVHDWFIAERELIEEAPVPAAQPSRRPAPTARSPKATARKRTS